MKQAGRVVVFRFPQTDLEEGKLRPALLLGKLPGECDDWLISMVSSQTRHYLAEFAESGLKVASVIRAGRLAVVSGEILLGAIGTVSNERLFRIKKHLSDWLSEK